MELKQYIVPIGGLDHTMQLTAETAKRMGVKEVAAKGRTSATKGAAPAADKSKAPAANKGKAPAANKSKTPAANKADTPDGDKSDDPARASDEDW